MDCPRCQVELVENHCPKCGYELPVLRRNASEAGTDDPGATVEQGAAKPSDPPAKDANWRSELKRKLDRHRKNVVAPPPRPKRDTPKKAAPPAAGRSARPHPTPHSDPKKGEQRPTPAGEKEIVRQLFRYRMGEQPQKVPERQVVSFRKKVSPEPGGEATKSDRPLIRKPLTGRRRSKMPSPTSDLLPLEKRPSLPPRPASNEQPDVVQAVIAEKVSSEILLSRFLSGIIDLGLAGLGGVFCAFLASRIVGVPYYSADVLGLVILSAILLFFINSVFFLVLLAKTPGMMWTDLRLVEDERDHPTSGAVLLRTLLFLPLAASVVGLVWALFDDQRRCWHDQLSGTRVVADSGN